VLVCKKISGRFYGVITRSGNACQILGIPAGAIPYMPEKPVGKMLSIVSCPVSKNGGYMTILLKY
jgi:hypothetical protein